MKSKKLFIGAKYAHLNYYYSRKPPKIKSLVEIGFHPEKCRCIFTMHDGRKLTLEQRAVFCLRWAVIKR